MATTTKGKETLSKSLCLSVDGIAMAGLFIIASEGRFGPANKPVKTP
ncbi:MAG: hypothetical protein ACTSYM_02640 [Candidatus Baldrarchaeia archaeon]